MIEGKIASIGLAISIVGSAVGYGTIYGGVNERIATLEEFKISRHYVPEAMTKVEERQTTIKTTVKHISEVQREYRDHIYEIKSDVKTILALMEQDNNEDK